MKQLTIVLLAGLVFWLGGCASTPPQHQTELADAKKYLEVNKTALQIASYHRPRFDAYPTCNNLTEVMVRFWQDDCELQAPFIALRYDATGKLEEETLFYKPVPYVDIKRDRILSAEEVMRRNPSFVFPEKVTAIKTLWIEGKKHEIRYQIRAKLPQEPDFILHLFRASDGRHLAGMA